jgi:hypothetical protein
VQPVPTCLARSRGDCGRYDHPLQLVKDAVRCIDRRSRGDGLVIHSDGAARFLNHHGISGQGYEHGSVDQVGQHQLLAHEVREEDDLHKRGDNRQSPGMAGAVDRQALWRLSIL